jgi:MYXO-CTERM domain-containing protein
MLIPVPVVLGEDDVSQASPELFQRFDNYSAPRVVRYECEDFNWTDGDADADTDADADADADADSDADPSVVVEAQYQVGIYDVVILSAEESGGLLMWLDANGYGVDPDAEEVLGQYIDSGSYFFAARVNLDEVTEDASFLEPLQFEYDSAVFSLPIRLGTINSPGEQDVVMYILTDEDDGKVGIANYPQITVEDECMVDIYGVGGVDAYYGDQLAKAWEKEDGAAWMVEYAWSPSSCDPCSTQPPTTSEFEQAGFDGNPWNAYFTRIRMRYTPEAADQDITLYASGIIENEQIRYIDHNVQMEDRYPVCGLGMVDNPGSCEFSDDDDDTSWLEEWYRNGGTTEDAEWEISVGGCSHAGGQGKGVGLAILLGLMGLGRRRRSGS